MPVTVAPGWRPGTAPAQPFRAPFWKPLPLWGPAPITVVQAAPTVNSSGATAAVTLPQPTGTGNTLVACITCDQQNINPAIASVTLGGVADYWRPAIADPGVTAFGAAIWYDPGCAAGQTAVTVSLTGGAGAGEELYVAVYEVAGYLVFDQGSYADGTGVTTWSSGTAPGSAYASEIFFGTSSATSAIPAVTGVGAWVTQQTGAGGFDQISGYQIATAPGTATFSGTIPAGAFSALVAAFSQLLSGATGAAGLSGSGALTALATQGTSASLSGSGQLTALATQGAFAPLAGSGQLATLATQGAFAPLSGSGALTALATQGAFAPLAGSGHLGALVIQGAIAALSGSGQLAASATQGAFAPLSGSGALGALGAQGAFAPLSGQGTLTALVIQGAIAPLSGSGQLAASGISGVSAALSGSGQLAASATQGAFAPLSGSGQLAGTGALTLRSLAPLSGLGSLASFATQGVSVTLAGSGTLSAAGSTHPPNVPGSGPSTVAGPAPSASISGPPQGAAVTDPRDGTHQVAGPAGGSSVTGPAVAATVK